MSTCAPLLAFFPSPCHVPLQSVEVVHLSSGNRTFFLYDDWITDKKRRVQLVPSHVGANNTYKVCLSYLLLSSPLLSSYRAYMPSQSPQPFSIHRSMSSNPRLQTRLSPPPGNPQGIFAVRVLSPGVFCYQKKKNATFPPPLPPALRRWSSRRATSGAPAPTPTSPSPCSGRWRARRSTAACTSWTAQRTTLSVARCICGQLQHREEGGGSTARGKKARLRSGRILCLVWDVPEPQGFSLPPFNPL